MRKIVILIPILILSLFALTYGQKSTGVYNYPIKPGSSEWKAFKSHYQMINACQLPTAIINKIKTEDLLNTCLDYPLYDDMFFYDRIQKGFDAVKLYFNGLKELLDRNDVGNQILDLYMKMDPNSYNEDWPKAKKVEFAISFIKIEVLLAQTKILNEFSKGERALILQECIKKAREKQKYPKYYGQLNYVNIGLIIGRILRMENHPSFLIKLNEDKYFNTFIDEGFYPSMVLIENLMQFADEYLDKYLNGVNHE